MPPPLSAVPADSIPCIGYIRVSMAREEMISPEIQKSAITAWALRTRRHIIDWVYDLDKTGRNFKRKVMKVIERVEAREAVEIAVYRYDRWGRNARESLANIYRVELIGGQLQSATEMYDAETVMGKYNRHNALGLAEMQSDLIGQSWKDALANRVDRKLPSNGTPRWGYQRHGRVPDPDLPNRYRADRTDPLGERYEPCPDAAPILVEMYDRYIAGAGFRRIAEWMNSLGLRNTRGNPWTTAGVQSVLDCGFGAGLLHIHNPDCRCRNPNCRNRIHIPGAHQPVLDAEGITWAAYQATRQRRRDLPPRARTAVYRITGIVRCGHCGGTMTPRRGPGNMRCATWQTRGKKACAGVWPKISTVEAALLERLREWAAEVDASTPAQQSRLRARESAEADRARLVKALGAAEAALTRLAVQRAKDPDMPAVIYKEAKEQLLADRDRAVRAMSSAPTVAEPDHFAPVIAGILEGWDLLPAGQVRDALMGLVRHVRVWRVRHGLQWVEVTAVWESCDCPLCKG